MSIAKRILDDPSRDVVVEAFDILSGQSSFLLHFVNIYIRRCHHQNPVIYRHGNYLTSGIAMQISPDARTHA